MRTLNLLARLCVALMRPRMQAAPAAEAPTNVAAAAPTCRHCRETPSPLRDPEMRNPRWTI